MPEVGAFPERDLLMLNYGCGIRNSELTGINLDDIRVDAEAIRFVAKGRRMRYVSVRGAAAVHLRLPRRAPDVLAETRKSTPALLINRRGGRLTTRIVGRISRRSQWRRGSRRRCIRIRCATRSGRTCWKKGLTCARFRNC